MTDRNSGATTRQMSEAPRGAFYVWPNSALSYPRALARHLDRPDLQIVSPASLDPPARRFTGVAVPIVIDHAAQLADRQNDELVELRRVIELVGGAK